VARPDSLPAAQPTARLTTLLVAAGLLASVAAGAAATRTDSRGTLALVTGALSGQGYRDGAAATARFSYPNGLAIGTGGTFYVADPRNHAIRRVSGADIVSTVAGTVGRSGHLDGPAVIAEFNGPVDVARDAAGNLFVVDSGNHVIRRIDREGQVTTFAGAPGQTGSADGTGRAARFNSPVSIALDPAGNLLVGDAGNQLVRRISPDGRVSTLAGHACEAGAVDGAGDAARFNGLGGIAVDRAGNVYLAETGNHTIRKVTANGVVTTVAGAAGQAGAADGIGAAARFCGPSGVACDSTGALYVADSYCHLIRRITPEGTVTTIAGRAWQTGSTDGVGDAARLKGPARLAVLGDGRLLFTDNNGQVRSVSADGTVRTIAGAPAQSGTVDGPALAARYNYTNGVAFDPAGNLYIVDMDNGTVRKMTPAGEVSTLVGTPGKFGNANGRGAEVQFGGAGAIAADATGNLFLTEFYNHAIRKITPDGTVTTFAGKPGQAGTADGVGEAAQFSSPNAIDADAAGNLYIADFGSHTVRKVTPDGAVSTIAGVAGKAGHRDGTAGTALFDGPAGVAVDASGAVYVTELNNHTVRRIAEGVVTTLAGAPKLTGSTDGKGGGARFSGPWGIAVHRNGNLYVCDSGNNAIRCITPGGTVTTIAGGAGPYWNEPGPLPGRLGYPISLTIRRDTGDLYVSVPDAVVKITLP
jgi:sugar lactone lactonase YvrE